MRTPEEVRASRERRVRELRLLARSNEAAARAVRDPELADGYRAAAEYQREHADNLQARIEEA